MRILAMHEIRDGQNGLSLVIWRKVSFGTDSPNGSRFAERMLTVIMTLRLQKRNVLDYVTHPCDVALLGQPALHAQTFAVVA